MTSKKREKNILKLVSVLIAFVLWLYVLSSEQVTMEKRMAVKYIFPKNKASLTELPSEVRYQLKGPRVFLRELVEREDIFIVDFKSMKTFRKNRYKVDMSDHSLRLPVGVQLLKSSHGTLEVKMDRQRNKLVSVNLVTQGEFKGDNKLKESSLEPKKILIKGPKNILNSIKSINTNVVDLTKLESKGKIKLGLELSDERLQFAKEDQVEWSYATRTTKVNKRIKGHPILFLTSKFISKVNISKANLTVLIDEDADLKLLSKIKVVASVPDDAKGKTKVKLEAQLPDSVVLLGIEPESIDVNVK